MLFFVEPASEEVSGLGLVLWCSLSGALVGGGEGGWGKEGRVWTCQRCQPAQPVQPVQPVPGVLLVFGVKCLSTPTHVQQSTNLVWCCVSQTTLEAVWSLSCPASGPKNGRIGKAERGARSNNRRGKSEAEGFGASTPYGGIKGHKHKHDGLHAPCLGSSSVFFNFSNMAITERGGRGITTTTGRSFLPPSSAVTIRTVPRLAVFVLYVSRFNVPWPRLHGQTCTKQPSRWTRPLDANPREMMDIDSTTFQCALTSANRWRSSYRDNFDSLCLSLSSGSGAVQSRERFGAYM